MDKEQRQIAIDLAADNADWIKTEENRQSEREIHKRLAEEHAEEQ